MRLPAEFDQRPAPLEAGPPSRRGFLLAGGLLGLALGFGVLRRPRLTAVQRLRRAQQRARHRDLPPGFLWIGHC